MTDVYLFTAEGASTASGAPVDSVVLEAGEGSRAVVFVDAERDAWGFYRLGGTGGPGTVERMRADSGLSGWVGEELVPSTVSVLPVGATGAGPTRADGVEVASATLAGHTALLVADTANPGSTSGTPGVRFDLDGRSRTVAGYQQSAQTLELGGVAVDVELQPTVLTLSRGDGRTQALVPTTDLVDGSAVSVPVTVPEQDAAVLLVPGWQPEAVEVQELEVLVGRGEEERCVPVASGWVGSLVDGRPVAVLGIAGDALPEGWSILEVRDGTGTRHPLPGGVVEVDSTL